MMHEPARCLTRVYEGCLILSVQVDHASALRGEESVGSIDGGDGWEHDAFSIMPQPDRLKPHLLRPVGRFVSLGQALAACREANGTQSASADGPADVLDHPRSEIAGEVRVETLL